MHARKHLLAMWNSTFIHWGLCWKSIQFMLKVTDTVLAGLTSTSLLFLNLPVLTHSGQLNFFIHCTSEKAILKHFDFATRFRTVSHNEVILLALISSQVKSTDHLSHMVAKTIFLGNDNKLDFPVVIAIHVCSQQKPSSCCIPSEDYRHIPVYFSQHLCCSLC